VPCSTGVTTTSPPSAPAGRRLPAVVAALGSPFFALALFWLLATACARWAPALFPAVAVLGLLMWLGTIYLVVRTFHRLLWQGRVTEASGWGKAMMTAVLTALWFGFVAQGLALAFPGYFKKPGPSVSAPDPAPPRSQTAAPSAR
jgi:hypothetical protein